MACDKRYGLRRVWVAAESAPNVPATFTDDSFLVTTGSTFPAMFREVIELNESLPGRAKYEDLPGAQNELNFEITVNMVKLDQLADYPALALLFWGLGSGPDDPALAGEKFDVDTGETGGCSIAIKNGTTCGRTLQLAGLDRDGLTLEVLTGCIVGQAVLTFSRTEQPTITFSGTAARKLEVNAFEGTTALTTGDNVIPAGAARTSFNRPSYMTQSGLNFGGISIVSKEGYKADLKKIEPGKINIGAFDTAPAAANSYHFGVIEPASITRPALVSPDSWGLRSIDKGGLDAQTALTITIESGLSYGDLTVAAPWPTEILSGQTRVTGSLTTFFTAQTPALIAGYQIGGDTGELEMIYSFGGTADLCLYNVRLTDLPELDVSSVDEAATLEISFNAYNSRSAISSAFNKALVVEEY